jgi:hypothetical protein
MSSLLEIFDTAHYVFELEEAEIVQREWWILKFKPSLTRLSALRAWERFKTKLRCEKIPHRLVSVGSGQELAVEFPPEAWGQIKQRIDRCQRELDSLRHGAV